MRATSKREGGTLTHLLQGQGAKIKIRQFNFELTFNGLICKRKWFISMLTIVHFGDLWANQVNVGFLQQLYLKNEK